MGELTPKAQEILGDSNWIAAVEKLHANATVLEVADRYDTMVRSLYWKGKDLPAVVQIGRTGITYCLGRAAEKDCDSQLATKLRSIAKGLAYNIGSFTWPGWEEPGIDPSKDELEFGAWCAQLNWRLAIELKKPSIGVSRAHWLIGAHALTSGDFALAERQFELAQEVFAADDPEANGIEPCNKGYLAIAKMCQNADDLEARTQFEEVTSKLQAGGDEDSKIYLTQLLSARRLYVPRPR